MNRNNSEPQNNNVVEFLTESLNKICRHRLDNCETNKEMRDDQYKKIFRNKIVRHMPIVLLIVFIINIILIYFSSENNLTEKNKRILEKFNILITGLTIMISGVYLLMARFEYVNKIKYYAEYYDDTMQLLKLCPTIQIYEKLW